MGVEGGVDWTQAFLHTIKKKKTLTELRRKFYSREGKGRKETKSYIPDYLNLKSTKN